ncbi:hypothetical protein HZS_2548 [Henneguya salminicola]|nr:hypothetical protein HZS_2548 [Henneguya salminicola]
MVFDAFAQIFVPCAYFVIHGKWPIIITLDFEHALIHARRQSSSQTTLLRCYFPDKPSVGRKLKNNIKILYFNSLLILSHIELLTLFLIYKIDISISCIKTLLERKEELKNVEIFRKEVDERHNLSLHNLNGKIYFKTEVEQIMPHKSIVVDKGIILKMLTLN